MFVSEFYIVRKISYDKCDPNWKHQHNPQFIADLQNNPNAQEFLANAPKKLNAQIKLFELDNASEIVMTYIRQYKRSLCNEAQVKLFELKNAAELLKEYTGN